MRQKRRNFRPRFVNRDKINKEQSKSAYGILPAPGILESYEEISAGSVDKIIEMVKVEQRHRHNLDKMQLQKYAITIWSGQILGAALLAVVILYACMLSISAENYFNAFMVAIGGFGFLAFCAWSSTRSKLTFNKYKKFTTSRK